MTDIMKQLVEEEAEVCAREGGFIRALCCGDSVREGFRIFIGYTDGNGGVYDRDFNLLGRLSGKDVEVSGDGEEKEPRC